MRIISGKFKARRIQVPNNISARPTTDFAKEGLFNLLNNQIDFEGIEVLDLFAGTGSISLEFVSRDALQVVSVENNRTQSQFIEKICKQLSVSNLKVVKWDVFKYIATLQQRFDVVFADPPYELERLPEIPDLIFQQQILKENGLLILEHSAKNSFETHPHFSFHRNYGNVNFSFFE